MAKWYGQIGYVDIVETEPGVHDEIVTERPYYGDVLKNYRSLQNNEGSTVCSVNISNQISIVADPYANDHIYAMRYVTFQNSKWSVTNVDVQFPRLILSLGGLYHDGN